MLIIINIRNFRKKIKNKKFFEKDKKLVICVPFYEDNFQTLNMFAINF